ncbi:hypothetical protein [Ochrobactrum sp. CGA5]|uniref:hypothetical protein n=1 Tax=Ochrobactrum sp. CGA5 TaxID=2583453 RepID=UPI00111EB985|nr:hypothetical protein [Ochrobactrum sp. CGA5]
MAVPSFIFGQGTAYKTPEQLQEARRRVQQLMSGGPQDYSRPGGWLYALGDGLGAALEQRRINQGEKYADEQRQKGNALFGQLMSGFGGAGGAYPSSVAAGGSPTSATATGTVPQGKFNFGENADALRNGIIETAQAIGADPVDLATAISYETAGTFDPTKAGPRTQYGQHRGLIQFGEPQAEKYGVDWNDPIASQLGPNGAVANYFRSSGFKPGMSGLDLYSTINAGSPGRYTASDANNGGAPGDVRDKWENQMTGHRQKALALLGSGNKPQPQGVQVASLDPSIGLGSASNEAVALFGPNADVTQADIEFARQATGPVGGAMIRAGDYNPDASRGNATANGARATFGGPQLTYDDGGLRFVDEGAQRVAAPPAVAPYDFTGNPQLSAASGMQFQGGQPQQMAALPQQPTPQAPTGPSAELLRQNDVAFGGALAPQGQAPQQVANASGYFPPAPYMDRALVQPQAAPQNNNRLQLLGEVLSNPFVPEEQKRIAQMMFQQEMEQRQQMADPMRQLQMRRLEQEIALGGRTSDWSKLDDNRLYNQRTGEIRELPVNPNAPSGDLGLNPQYGVDKDGNPVLLQLGKNGKVVQSQLPEGVSLSKEPIKLDAGTHFVLLDPITRQPVGQIPKDVAGAASQAAIGKSQGEAAASLPGDLQQAEQTISQIDSLLASDGLSSIVGPVDQYRPSWSLGSSGRDALSRLRQLQGGAFLQAFGMLKGGGQITEIEGAKAEAAMARMDRALNEEDFRNALKDFRDAVSQGMVKMRRQAGVGAGSQAQRPEQVPNGDGVQINGYTIRKVQ